MYLKWTWTARVQFHSKLLIQEDKAKIKFKLDKISATRVLTVVKYKKRKQKLEATKKSILMPICTWAKFKNGAQRFSLTWHTSLIQTQYKYTRIKKDSSKKQKTKNQLKLK